MRRIMAFSRFDEPLFELAENDVFELTRTEQINGEHALTITTTRQLEQGQRILLQDDRLIWREYVVFGVDAKHDSGERPFGTYYCTWSLQPDLMGTRVSAMPGTSSPVAAAIALDAAIEGTSRWTRGTVTNTNTGGASMYDTDGWSALSTLVDVWGGELSTTIEVGSMGVTARHVDLYSQMGDQSAKRRFDFGADLSSVRRTIADGPMYCRITPRGKGEESGGGYGRKITIEDVNDGKDYLENAAMTDLAKLPDGNGGWEYPTVEIENSNCETPADLKAWALTVLEDYTVPRITYEVDVLQLAREGIDLQGVSLGDAVHIVDRKFGGGLRLSGRVVSMTVDELSGSTSQLTIGHIEGGLAGMFGSLGQQVAQVTETVQVMNGGTLSTADYLDRLLDRINAEINATGGYTYITQGQGIRTYDTAVSDPLVGSEASAVVEIKGGTIRIANSKTAQGEWEWKTVFTSGHIAADMVTAANLTAGYIGSASSGSYWDLDSNALSVKNGTITGGTIIGSAISSQDGKFVIEIGGGSYAFQELRLKIVGDYYLGISNAGMWVKKANYDSQGNINGWQNTGNMLQWQYSQSGSGAATGIYGFTLGGSFMPNWSSGSLTMASNGNVTLSSDNTVYLSSAVRVNGTLVVTGSKSREAETDNYGRRLLYAYETPSPMFGDLGSGTIGEDGLCYVEIDDIFGETARTDIAYQVFLQKCGEGDCWVDEKRPNYFVVSGTPGLPFDWEIKAAQRGYTSQRLEAPEMDEAYQDERVAGADVEALQQEELSLIYTEDSY